MRPLVALTTTTVAAAPESTDRKVSLYTAYLEVLEGLQLTPVLLTPAHSPESTRVLLERCAGLVLSGGEDVDPVRYGEVPIPELGTVNAERDALELAAIGQALARGIPLLAICRGCQVLNVYFGGTLYQDLAAQRPGVIRHRQQESWDARTHRVVVDPEARFHDLIGAGELLINSFHHQAVKDLAPELRVSARADDGLIEAFEARNGAWVFGVQWHPERLEAGASPGGADARLFAAFADAVRERARGS